MTEYLINCGGFNILVVPDRKHYFIIDGGEAAQQLLSDFLDGRELAFAGLEPRWFQYRADESWHCLDGSAAQLGQDLNEQLMIDYFVLKKHNFGSLVAVRDGDSRKLKIFKRPLLSEIASESA